MKTTSSSSASHAAVRVEPFVDLIRADGPVRRLFADAPYTRTVLVPEEGIWYALHTGRFRWPFGMSGLCPYVAREYPDRLFSLGLFGTMGLSAIHARGLSGNMRLSDAQWRETFSLRDLTDSLNAALREGMVRAARAVNGPGDILYETLYASLDALTRAALREWFPIFYARGFLIDAPGFRIEGINSPTVRPT